MALLDNGAQINTIMPRFIENHALDVRPLSDLIGRCHLHRPRECTYLTYRLCHHTG